MAAEIAHVRASRKNNGGYDRVSNGFYLRYCPPESFQVGSRLKHLLTETNEVGRVENIHKSKK